MTQPFRVLLALAALAVASACDKGEETPADTGAVDQPDAGGGNPDAIALPDAEVDAGGEPVDGGGYPDAAPDAGYPDAEPPPPTAVQLSGKVVKLGAYLAGENQYAGQASVLALGVVPQQSTLTSEQQATLGEYSLNVPANGQILLFTQKLGYFPTYNNVTTQTVDITAKNIYLTELAWLNEIAAAHNVDLVNDFACHGAPQGSLDPNQRCIYSVVVGRILDDGTAGNGTRRPVGGVAKTDFSITYGAMAGPWYTKGPYFLDYTGTSSVTATTSVVYNDGNGNYKGGLFAFFAEIPRVDGAESRDLSVSITYNYNGNNRYFGPLVVKTFRPYGVSWVNLYETGQPPPPLPPGNIDFDTQIYPLFLPVASGGFGCQGCHTNQNPAVPPSGGMNLYGGPEIAYNSLNPTNYPDRVNIANPALSLVLKKPLYEAVGVQDHPIFAFASELDPGYQLIYTWISQGGMRPLTPPPPVSFSGAIRPLLYNPTATGGAGCITCHGDPLEPEGAWYMGGNAQALYDKLTATAPSDNGGTGEPYRVNKQNYPERSLVLINPLNGNPEPHPVKIFADNADPRYQLIYRWIAEGYQNN